MNRRNFIAAAILTTTPALSRPKTMTEYAALRYSKTTEPDLRLRLLVPTSSIPVPFVVHAHGKGTAYDSTNFDTVFNAILAQGIAVASIQYQDSDDGVIMPAPIQQAYGAIRFLRGSTALYNLQGTKTGLMGSSEGSALMTQVATQYDTSWVGTFGLYPNKATKTRALCAVSGAVFDPDLTNFSPAAEAFIAAQYGCSNLTTCSPTALYLPQYHLSSDRPDALFIAGDADTDVPIAHSQATVNAMNLAGMNATLITNPGTPHGWINANLQVAAIATFFASKLL